MIILVYQFFLFLILTSSLFCGAVKYEGNKGLRKIGGYDTSILDAPFIGSLQWRKIHVCGAVIVTRKYLLTAAHCLVDISDEETTCKKFKVKSPKYYTVSTGSKYVGRGIITKVRQFFVPGGYDAEKIAYDFGAIALKRDLEFNMKTQPAKLPGGNITETAAMLDKYAEARTECKAYGWRVTAARPFSGLMVVGLHLVKKDVCQGVLTEKKMGRLYDKIQFCTLEESEKKDTCQSDSGGPLSCNGVIWGLLSWCEGCARPGNPGIFARTDVAKRWLDKVIVCRFLDSKNAKYNKARHKFIISGKKNVIILILNACFILHLSYYLSK